MTQDRQPFQLQHQQFPGPRGVVYIDVYKHPSIGQKYVFWDDIKQVFPQAQCVFQGSNVVNFLRDDQGVRYDPLRIAFQPGTVLGVMLNEVSACPPALPDTGSVTLPSSHQPSDAQDSAPPPDYSPRPSFGDNPLGNDEIAKQCLEPQSETTSSSQSTTTHDQSIISSEREPSSSAWYLPQTSRSGTLIQHLFILLPPPGNLPLDISTFRVRFLCDAGVDPAPGPVSCGSPVPQHVHVTLGTGYGFRDPTIFLEKYGRHAFALMKAVRNKVPVHGLQVPSLGHLLLGEPQDGCKIDHQLAEQAMDNIMVYLETVFDKEASLVAKSDLQLGVDQGTIAESSVIEKLECIDWEDMLTYLTDWDPWNKRPDGLYRILNDDGHISWHCPDHLRRTHVVALEYTVISSGGECDLADEGRIRLTLRCAPTMVRFLDQLRRAKVIRHLDLTLAWDTTLIDLMWLRDNLLYIGLRTLRLDCGGYTGPLYDCKNRSKRGDPFAHLLMSAHKLNRFCVRGADGVFSQSSVFTHTPTSLQEVHIESTFDPLVQQSKLETLIRMSPKLIFLSLSCRDDGFCRTVNIVRQSIMDHKTFRYLRLTSPSFAIQLDKNEPDSRLSVPPLPSEDLPKGQHLNPTYFILLDYGAHLSRITVGDNFYDAHVLLLRNIVASAHKLVQLDINVDTKIGTHSRVSNNGRAMLASIIPQLDNCHISVTSRFKEKHWVPFVASMYPFLNSVSLRTPDVNQRLQELSRLLVQGKVPSKIKTFTFIGTEFSMKAPTVQALVHILDSSPNLETLRLSHCHAKTMDDWRVILGAIRFDTLLRLSIRSNSFHDCSQGYFPVDAIPRDAVLQHLDMSKCSFPIVLKAALQKDLKERFPHLDIVF